MSIGTDEQLVKVLVDTLNDPSKGFCHGYSIDAVEAGLTGQLDVFDEEMKEILPILQRVKSSDELQTSLKKGKIFERVKRFLEQQPDRDHIEVLPIDIARMMGHAHIADLLPTKAISVKTLKTLLSQYYQTNRGWFRKIFPCIAETQTIKDLRLLTQGKNDEDRILDTDIQEVAMKRQSRSARWRRTAIPEARFYLHNQNLRNFKRNLSATDKVFDGIANSLQISS